MVPVRSRGGLVHLGGPLTIQLHDGRKFRLGSGIERLDDLANQVYETLFVRLAPTLDAMRRGETVSFGSVQVDRTGITQGERMLANEEKTLGSLGKPKPRTITTAELFAIQAHKKIAALGKTTPRTISALDLTNLGPGDDVNVIVTEFEVGNQFVWKHSGPRLDWESVYVPIHAKRYGKSGQPFKIVYHSLNIHNQADLRDFSARNGFGGVVINAIQSKSKEMILVKEAYPAMDLQNVWVVQEGWRFPTPASIQRNTRIRAGIATGSILALFLAIHLARMGKHEPRAPTATAVTI